MILTLLSVVDVCCSSTPMFQQREKLSGEKLIKFVSVKDSSCSFVTVIHRQPVKIIIMLSIILLDYLLFNYFRWLSSTQKKLERVLEC